MNSLVVGIALIVGGLAFAVYPFLRRKEADDDAPPVPAASAPRRGAGQVQAGAVATRRAPAPVEAIVDEREELELDRAMGKLSDADYARLLAGLDRRGATRVPPADSTTALVDEAERLVAAARATVVLCATCGPRPEPGARFCSQCGASLGGCPACGSEIRQAGARFCDQCGTALRA